MGRQAVILAGKKIKVTHVTRYAYPHVGGIEAVISQINECLPDDKYEKEVLCCSNTEKSSIENSVKYKRCKFLFEFAANTISPEFIWKLSKVDTDILHYHMPFIFAVIAHFIARPKYKKLYISYHGGIVGYDKYMWPFWGIYKYFYKIADKIHVLSPYIINKDIILAENKEKCVIIPYGITPIKNKESLQQETEHYRQQFNNKKIILCVGRLARMKGFLNAIKAMQLVEGAILLIAGDGPLRASYEKYINENNLKDKVILLGNVTDKHKKEILFNSCDILVLPSVFNHIPVHPNHHIENVPGSTIVSSISSLSQVPHSGNVPKIQDSLVISSTLLILVLPFFPLSNNHGCFDSLTIIKFEIKDNRAL